MLRTSKGRSLYVDIGSCEGWGRERPALIRAKEEAEQELRRLKDGAREETAGEDRIGALNEENTRLRSELETLREEKKTLSVEKENLSIELDGVRQAYDELKQTTIEASERLDSTLEELKILRG